MDIYKLHAHNRSVGWSTWHMQWCTKYRYKIFGSKERREFCKIILCETAKKHNFEMLDCEVDIDHVHVLVSLPLTMTPLRVVQYLKGRSAKGMFLIYPELHKLYKRGHIWSPGKFVGSVGHITLDKAKMYLEAHHAKNSSNGNPSSEAKRRSRPKGEPLGLGGRQVSVRLACKIQSNA